MKNIFNSIIRFPGDIWCLFIHDFLLDKVKPKKAYGPGYCSKCGRIWEN